MSQTPSPDGVLETHIIGPPGTGKTTKLREQVAKALGRYKPEQIIVMSFTKAAAANVAGRGVRIPRRNVATIHSFAYRLLGRPDIAETKIGEYNKQHAPERQLTVQRIDDDLDGGSFAERRTVADEMFERSQSLRNRLIPRDEWPDEVQAWFADDWQPWKDSVGLADFTDLLEHAYQDDSEIEWETVPKVAFVDEAQDNSPLEMALIRRWAQSMDHLVLVGDPDQAIFAFKGVDPKAMTTTDARHKRIVLEQSYRVPRRVHALARAWIKQIADREDAPYRSTEVDGEVAFGSSYKWKDPETVIDEAAESERTCMLLTSCSYQLEPIRKELKRRAIPFGNPYRAKRLDWNPLRLGGRGVGACERLWRFTLIDHMVHGKDARMWTWSDIKAWLGPLSAGVFKRGKRTELEKVCKAAIEAEEAEKAEDAEFDFDSAPPEKPTLELLRPYFASDDEFASAASGEIEWYYNNLQMSHTQRFSYPYAVASRHGVAALNEPPKIVIGTIHSVKGAEAEDVYLFPDLSVASHRDSVVYGDAHNVRTYYVGITRASRRLIVCNNCESYYMLSLLEMAREAAAKGREEDG